MLCQLLMHRQHTEPHKATRDMQKIVEFKQARLRKILRAWKRWKEMKELNAMIETGHVRFLLQGIS